MFDRKMNKNGSVIRLNLLSSRPIFTISNLKNIILHYTQTNTHTHTHTHTQNSPKRNTHTYISQIHILRTGNKTMDD